MADVIPYSQRPLGAKLIIGYKFVRAPLMLTIALALTVAPEAAFRSLGILTQELAEAGATWARVGAWIHANLTSGTLAGGTVLAWLDGASTAIEGLLLLSGKPLAEWIVIIELACLLPFEIAYLAYRPGLGKVILLAINALIVLYLARNRLHRTREQASMR